jgi:hypothetical protein
MVSSFGYLPLAAVDMGAMTISGIIVLVISLALGSLWLKHKNASLDCALLLSSLFSGVLLRGLVLLLMAVESPEDLSTSVSLERITTYTTLWQASTLLLTSSVWLMVTRVLRSALRRNPQSRNDTVDRAIVFFRGLASLVPAVLTIVTYKVIVTGSFGSTDCSRHGVSGEVLMGYRLSDVDASATCGDPTMWYAYAPAFALGAIMSGAAIVTDRSKWAPDNNAKSWIAGCLLSFSLGLATALGTADSISANLGALVFLTLESLLVAVVGLVVNANLEVLDSGAQGHEFMGVLYAVDNESQRAVDQAAAAGATVSLGTV